jgi:hypothetical protein
MFTQPLRHACGDLDLTTRAEQSYASDRFLNSVVRLVSRFSAGILGDKRSALNLPPAVDQLLNSQFLELARMVTALRHKVIDERHHEAANDGACERRDQI